MGWANLHFLVTYVYVLCSIVAVIVWPRPINTNKGRCTTYDVHTEGEGGVEPKEDVVREVA